MTKEARDERFALVLELREKDKRTYRSIGAQLGVGIMRARQIYEEAVKRRSLAPGDPRLCLRGKTWNLLNYHDIETREEARRAFESGKMQPRYWYGLGKKTLAEIAAWAGLEIKPPPPKKVRVCPHCGKELP
jgi:Sigma-70, region 4